MRKGGGYLKWHLVMLVQLLLILQGVKMQQQQPNPQQVQVKSQLKPQVYWATSVDSSNRRFQQANEWSAVQNNYLDRQWTAPAPNPPSLPAPAPAYAPPPPPAPPTPPPYTPPAPPAYQEPAPPTYPEPAPPGPVYEPAPAYDSPSYGAPAPSYEAPASPPGYYYYYYPVKEVKKGPSIKDLIDKEKEAIAAMMPDKVNKLTYEQKIWLSVLTPLIIVALGFPLAAILFSGVQITTNGRKFGELNIDEMAKTVTEIAQSYGTVLESEECMQRIICDLGSYAKDVPGKTYVLMFLSNLVPDTMKNNMAIFQKAATYGAEKAQCSSFKCSAWKY